MFFQCSRSDAIMHVYENRGYGVWVVRVTGLTVLWLAKKFRTRDLECEVAGLWFQVPGPSQDE